MFATNIAEKSSGELGSAWQRYRNTDHQGWVLPWELSLGTEQGGEGETLCPGSHESPHGSEGESCKSLLRAMPAARSGAALSEPLTGQDLGAEFVITIGEKEHLSGRRRRGLQGAWKGLSHSLSASATEEKSVTAKQPPGALSAHPLKKKKLKNMGKNSTANLSRIPPGS